MNGFPTWVHGTRTAPSVYNTQPWKCVVQPGGDLLLCWDQTRFLPHSDPTFRNAYLSLGAAIEAACLRSYRDATPVRFEPVDYGAQTLGRFVPCDMPDDPTGIRLAKYLETRHTARSRHLRIPLPPVVQMAFRREAVGWGCRFLLVTDGEIIRKLASTYRVATAQQQRHRGMRREMAAWIRTSNEHGQNQGDGVSIETLQLGATTRWAQDWLVAHPESNGPMQWGAGLLLGRHAGRIARDSASFGLLTAASTDQEDMLRAGRLLLRLWLLATEAGLSLQPLSAILRFPNTLSRCLHLFEASNATPACVFRLGFTPPPPTSQRLPVDAIVSSSSYFTSAE